MHKPLHEYAQEIWATWNKPYFGAVPYLEAMESLNQIDDSFMYDSAREIVIRFLGNAQTWRGEDAKRIKAELKKLTTQPTRLKPASIALGKILKM